MDTAKTTCDMVLTCWKETAKYRKYIRSLGDNLAGLESKMVELDGVYKDVKRLVERAEGEGRIRKDDPARWLTKVEDLKQEVDRILVDGKVMMGKSCLCGLCFINCRARYKLSELAEAKRADLETELAQGRNNFRVLDDVAYEPADLILERSLRALRKRSGELRDLLETVKLRVKREEERHMVRTPEVGGWLRRVEDLLEKEVVEILEQGKVEMEKARRSHGGAGAGAAAGDDPQTTQRNFKSYHGISKRADEESNLLKEKLIEGHGFVDVAYKPDVPLVVEIPIDRPVGANSTFKEVWDWIEDETVKCIGLFGMGGVGKTHLLDRVHNQFLKVPHNYDLVLRIVVSRPANLDRVQVAILEKLKLQEDDWKRLEKIERAALIQRHMKNHNFLLFLDDLWDPINLLTDVGIPCHDNPRKYKIIFTTRQERVCNGMKADRTKKLDCLPPDEALQLFCQILGEKTWSAHPWIPNIAERLVHECKYLPLAIKVIAGAMVGIEEVARWREAEEDLKSRWSEIEDMEKEVLRKLEFSYDRLPDETHKKCFLYLSIFPEDHEISKHDVINLWIGEGFFDVRDKGERIFRRLRDACLVEFVQSSKHLGESVKMHDVTREMALWVYSDHGQKNSRVLVQEGSESFRSKKLKEWKDVERISLWDGNIEILDSLAKLSCSHLSTLIIKNSFSRVLDESLLSMPGLRVLDISDFRLRGFPDSFWNLTNLRYLKVTSRSIIIDVPVEIKNLNKLEVLILSQNFRLPVEVIPNLSSLRVFRWMDTLTVRTYLSYRQGSKNFGDYEIGLLEALQMTESLEEINLTLVSHRSVEKLLDCHKLWSHLSELVLRIREDSYPSRTSTPLPGRLENLRFLSLYRCITRQMDISCQYGESLAPPKLSTRLSNMYGYQRLCHVSISKCQYLEDVTSLIYQAPVLETLYIDSCSSLQELIVGDVEDDHVNGLFPCLKYLYLKDLNRLERICRRALPFPSLEKIEVHRCPILREISLNGDSAKNSLKVIKGGKRWWEVLEWDDPAAKQVFSAKFIRVEPEDIW